MKGSCVTKAYYSAIDDLYMVQASVCIHVTGKRYFYLAK